MRKGSDMWRLALLGIILFLNLSPAALAEDETIPLCASEEILDIFSVIVAHQLKLDESFASIDDLLAYSRAQIDFREQGLSQLPYCADAIALRRAFTEIGADAVARGALELAGMSPNQNPYRLQLASDRARVMALAASMFAADRAAASAPAQSLPEACQPADIQRLERAIAGLLDLLEATATVVNRAHYALSVDRRLQWREDNLSRQSDCADAVEAALRMSETATDAAAHHALAYAGVSSAINPFIKLEAEGAALLRNWGEQMQITREASLTAGGALPPCSLDEATAAYQILLSYRELRARSAMITTRAGLLGFSAGLIAYRENQLSQMPLCAEAFFAGWWIGEALGDLTAQAVSFLEATPAWLAGSAARAEENAAKAEAGLARLKRLLDGEGRLMAPALDGAATCSDAEYRYFASYIVPEFREFLDSALEVSSAAEAGATVERSAQLRDLIWAHTPRCAETLEQGMIMRVAASDFSAMLLMESAGLAAEDIPYTRAAAANIEGLLDQIAQLQIAQLNEGAPVASAGNIYFVVAETIANVRACGSTDCEILATLRRGDTLDVLDDSGSWYEVQLPDGQTAFIAGFLASKTKP